MTIMERVFWRHQKVFERLKDKEDLDACGWQLQGKDRSSSAS